MVGWGHTMQKGIIVIPENTIVKQCYNLALVHHRDNFFTHSIPQENEEDNLYNNNINCQY